MTRKQIFCGSKEVWGGDLENALKFPPAKHGIFSSENLDWLERPFVNLAGSQDHILLKSKSLHQATEQHLVRQAHVTTPQSNSQQKKITLPKRKGQIWRRPSSDLEKDVRAGHTVVKESSIKKPQIAGRKC